MVDISELDGTWDYGELPANVRLGSNCFIQAKSSFRRFFTVRDPGLVVGDNVRIYSGTGFGIEKEGFMQIGDDTVVVGGSFMCAERITVGSRVLISYNVIVADADFHPPEPELRRRDAIANAPGGDFSLRPPYPSAPVDIEDDVSIGISAIILKGVRIAAGATVGPGAVVISDVPEGATVLGNPARISDPGAL